MPNKTEWQSVYTVRRVAVATAENQSNAIGKKFSSSKSMSMSIKSSTLSTASSEFIELRLHAC
jgi:hypothetical protein